ncbi:DegQ family serine endoprotease [Neptuniibacter sp. CAU 1671]|uniref:DegQ family serine endoprotease n=1 Tax=Neptuniibacter sp. CAU 1671 TaxID=3032593 RepID=UPI0023DA1F8C|nr:DegQ family serine endoprotease [Neptuniibacter sp. CAU 1671]MDF2180990.1 DegQ family serine endoprotease [Neptuniibacter sp. CAU 1671]
MKQFVGSLLTMLILACSPLSHAVLPSVDPQGEPLPSLAPMLEKVNPAVVNIATYSTLQYRYNPLLNDPFFRRFFAIPDQVQPQMPQKRQQSAGSGVIVDAGSGVVITNYHVIKGADEVHVSLVDGRQFRADVLGHDVELDIAVLKIAADNLTEVKLANSSHIRVGDFVVAIGNPFGLGQTVTTGVVSALGRSGLGIEGFEDFIQTDASINPGNSGGALVNLRGELVGINTAILAPSGGNIGIGFAIPINMAKASMEQILQYGEVKRGQIGIAVQELNPELREALELPNGQQGVLITGVAADSSAQKAGLNPGDVITHLNGTPVLNSAQLRSRIGTRAIGQTLELRYLRQGQQLTSKVEIEPYRTAASGQPLHPLLAGVELADDPEGGVRVVTLQPNSTAAYSGLRPGDLIVGANKRRTPNLELLSAALDREPRSLLLQVSRNGTLFYVVVR